MTIVRALAVVFVALPALPAGAAQSSGSSDGPTGFAVRPSITLSDVGMDTNILGAARNPKDDTTANLTMRVEPSVVLGRARLSGQGNIRMAYYREYTEERSVDTADAFRLELRGSRMTGYALGSFLRTREPFDAEIYARTRRTERSIGVGGGVRLTGKTQIGFAGRRTHVDFSGAEGQLGAVARETLNRRMNSVDISLRNAVTPLTTAVAMITLQRDRFDFSRLRDADGMRVLGGLEFAPTAVIAGKAYAGYRRFDLVQRGDRAVSRFVGSIDLTYTLGDSVRYSLRVERDLEHSFHVTEPYYTTNDIGVAVTRRITRALEVTGYAGRQWLKYRDTDLLATAAVEQGTRDPGAAVDGIFRYGAAATCRVGPRTRVGIRTDYYQLQEALGGPRYGRLRLVSSLEYRFSDHSEPD